MRKNAQASAPPPSPFRDFFSVALLLPHTQASLALRLLLRAVFPPWLQARWLPAPNEAAARAGCGGAARPRLLRNSIPPKTGGGASVDSIEKLDSRDVGVDFT